MHFFLTTVVSYNEDSAGSDVSKFLITRSSNALRCSSRRSKRNFSLKVGVVYTIEWKL